MSPRDKKKSAFSWRNPCGGNYNFSNKWTCDHVSCSVYSVKPELFTFMGYLLFLVWTNTSLTIIFKILSRAIEPSLGRNFTFSHQNSNRLTFDVAPCCALFCRKQPQILRILFVNKARACRLWQEEKRLWSLWRYPSLRESWRLGKLGWFDGILY